MQQNPHPGDRLPPTPFSSVPLDLSFSFPLSLMCARFPTRMLAAPSPLPPCSACSACPSGLLHTLAFGRFRHQTTRPVSVSNKQRHSLKPKTNTNAQSNAHAITTVRAHLPVHEQHASEQRPRLPYGPAHAETLEQSQRRQRQRQVRRRYQETIQRQLKRNVPDPTRRFAGLSKPDGKTWQRFAGGGESYHGRWTVCASALGAAGGRTRMRFHARSADKERT